MSKLDFAVIVLNWNSYEETISCIRSIKEKADIPFQMIVIDNNSSDNSEDILKKYILTYLPSAIYIQSGENIGYCGGNNLGLEKVIELGFEYVLVINNDVVFEGGKVLSKLKQKLSEPLVKIVSPNVNGEIVCSGYFYKLLDRFLSLNINGVANEVSYVCGCAIAFKVDFLKGFGIFPAEYFMYVEEIDICYRARVNGFKVVQLVDYDTLVIRKNDEIDKTSNRQYVWFYQTRNMLLFLSKCDLAFFQHVLMCFLFMLISIVRPLKQKCMKNYKPIVLGFIHFLKRRIGKSYR
ncbi:glycosyltransferase family 2 protein [Aeromonas veronii]